MNFENLGEIIDFAIEKEREAAEFYKKIGNEEKDFSGSKKMFAEFAEEEQKHEKILRDFKNKGVSESLAEYKLEWIIDIKRSDYLVDLDYEQGMPYNEILLLAMKREEKALKLYNDFLEQADTDESKKLFKVLCQEEAKHKLALETIYDDYMAQMGD
jgi:rubrerythrin